MSVHRERFSSRASPELLTTMREIARMEGRPFQAALEDAMQEYIQNCTRDTPRAAVMGHFRDGVERNRRLYELLAG